MDLESRYHLISKNGEILFSNLDDDKCFKCQSSCKNKSEKVKCALGETRRQGRTKTANGDVYYCTTNKDQLKSSRLFKKSLNFYETLIHDVNIKAKKLAEESIDSHNEKTRKLIHNLTTLNAHCIQEVFSFIDEDEFSEIQKEQISKIENQILSKKTEAAKLVLKILKQNQLMKTEFSVFNNLFKTNPRTEKRLHDIRKVLLNVSHAHFQDFTDRGIYMKFQKFNDRAMVDYESVTAAFFHLIGNAAKFCLPNSKVFINFDSNRHSLTVKISMVSLKIPDNELDRLYEDGFSGEFAKKSESSGDGIGMYMVKRLLALNHATIKIHRNVKSKLAAIEKEIPYENNIFELTFSKSK